MSEVTWWVVGNINCRMETCVGEQKYIKRIQYCAVVVAMFHLQREMNTVEIVLLLFITAWTFEII